MTERGLSLVFYSGGTYGTSSLRLSTAVRLKRTDTLALSVR